MADGIRPQPLGIADGRIRRRKCAKCARQWRTVERVVDAAAIGKPV